jgi:hypothetical protein
MGGRFGGGLAGGLALVVVGDGGPGADGVAELPTTPSVPAVGELLSEAARD